MFDFDTYAKDPPKLHSWDAGKTFNSGGFTSASLLGLRSLVQRFENPKIVETGVGNSTIVFLSQLPSKLITIAPDDDVWNRTLDFCNQAGLSLVALQKVLGFSEECLPKIALDLGQNNDWFDVALIDGGHGWPCVFLDLFYVNYMLRKGAILIIDDVQIYAVNEMTKYISGSPDYKLVGRLSQKTAVFEKISENRRFTHWSSYLMQRDAERKNSPEIFAF